MKNLSKWHKAENKPYQVGVYELDEFLYPNKNRTFSYWDGNKFCYRVFLTIQFTEQDAVNSAFKNQHNNTVLPALAKWRGLVKKQK